MASPALLPHLRHRHPPHRALVGIVQRRNVAPAFPAIVVPGVIDSVGTPIKSPFSGQDHRVRVSLRSGFEYLDAEYGSGTTTATGGVKLDFKDSYGQFARIHLTQNGIPRRP
jgi:hypothetical protein